MLFIKAVKVIKHKERLANVTDKNNLRMQDKKERSNIILSWITFLERKRIYQMQTQNI